MIVESKSDYARRRDRSAAAVTQWIKSGLLFGPAIQGKGRSARIVVDVADAQLASRADPGQALGNGRVATERRSPLKPEKPLKARAALKADPPIVAADPAAEPDYVKERALLTRENRIKQEMENARQRHELLTAAEVDQRWSEIVSDTRSILLAAAGRMRQQFSSMTPEQVAWIDAEHRRALMEMSRVRPPR